MARAFAALPPSMAVGRKLLLRFRHSRHPWRSPSSPEFPAAGLGLDCDDARPRRGVAAVRPVALRILRRARIAGMLQRQEQRAAIGRKLAAADLGADGAAHELAHAAALRAFRRANEAAVVIVAGL